MKTYEEIEYSDISLQFEQYQIHGMVQELLEVGIPVSWRETRKLFTLSVQTENITQRLHFDRDGKFYRLRNKSYNIKDPRFSDVFQKYIQQMKGHAIMKFITNDLLVVQNIRYGEPVRIVQIKGPQKKVLFEKECTISLNQVIEAFKRQDAEERIPILRLELDYALACLFEAIHLGNQHMIEQYKEILDKLRIEMLMLEM
ncbi:MAG TPA: hypothetical protein VJ824_08115 [Bacillota bacterium]|nr:hypothetical protein [Bacillota bacterium]